MWYSNATKRYIINAVAYLPNTDGKTILTTDEAYGKDKNAAVALFLASISDGLGVEVDWRLVLDKIEVEEYPEIK